MTKIKTEHQLLKESRKLTPEAKGEVLNTQSEGEILKTEILKDGGRMTNTIQGFDRSVVNAHEQKYPYSCAPSAVEIVLKLIGKVDKEYYCLQDHWNEMKCRFERQGRKDFADFQVLEAEKIKNVDLIRICDRAETILNRIEKELNSNRYVIVSLQNPNSNCYHVWVIYGKEGNEYVSVSKRGRNTIDCNNVKQIVCDKWISRKEETDILVYRAS